MEKEKNLGLFFYLDPTHSLKKHILQCLPIQDQISFSFFGEKFLGKLLQPCFAFLHVVSEKKQIFPYHYIFQYPLTNNMCRYLENKQLKNGGLNTLRAAQAIRMKEKSSLPFEIKSRIGDFW
jgi:hypothetical protein